MKTFFLSLLSSCVCLSVFSQALFTYGNKAVSKQEFVNAFDKNPSADTTSREVALRSYLNLYINYKLKVQAAHDEKLDVTDEYRSDRDRFKMDMAETAINNEANIGSLVKEAFLRSRKDIQLAQVFISVPVDSDTSEAYKKINEAYSELKNGKSFTDVIAQYTQDAAAKKNGGNIGFITVFTLPYEAENIVYNLKPGEFAKPYHSRIGYHIFKEISERQALGNRKIQYLLFPVSPTPNEAEKTAGKQLADSIYNLIQNGASFADMQAIYSTKKNGQNTVDVSVGQYDSEFENAVFSLQKEGDISKPFYTAYGWNIIKLVEKKAAVVDTADIAVKAAMQEKISADDRLTVAKNNLEKKWMTSVGYKPGVYKADDLWAFTDSAVQNGNTPSHVKAINNSTVLFSFTAKKITPEDWIRYVQMRAAQQSNRKLDYKALMPQFISYTTTNYYKEHIEKFHPELKSQLDEFNDANLLFAAMDKHVWSKASTDTVGLLQYYKAHKEKYTWQPGADAIIVTANNKQVATELSQKIKEQPGAWHDIVNSYGSLAQADSSRFEFDQLPVKNTADLKAGYISGPATVSDGVGYTFIYITSIHAQTEPRNFDDARGMVINDYQQVVEEKWIADVKKKYPVKVNEVVFKSIK